MNVKDDGNYVLFMDVLKLWYEPFLPFGTYMKLRKTTAKINDLINPQRYSPNKRNRNNRNVADEIWVENQSKIQQAFNEILTNNKWTFTANEISSDDHNEKLVKIYNERRMANYRK